MAGRSTLRRGFFMAILLLECYSSATAATTTCDFEKDLCGFITNTTKEHGFRVGKVAQELAGPDVDHKPGTVQGSCAYASNLGISALTIPAKGPFCFTGWYHHSGIRTTTASFQSSQNGGRNITFRFVSSGVASSWQPVVYSETRTGDHQIVITVSNDISEHGTFAVDDITLQDGICAPAPADGSCDFDWGNACGYSVSNSSRDAWALNYQSAVPERSSISLKASDVTVGASGGGYALHRPSSYEKSSALMSSPKLKGHGEKLCLRFYYYVPWYPTIFSDDNHTLEVSMLDGADVRTPLWKRSGKGLLSDEWVMVEVSFIAKTTFQLDFNCSIDAGFHLGFYCAVDAVRLSDCDRPEGQYRQECDFEEGLCSWRNVRSRFNKLLPWVLNGGTIKSSLRRPSADHTFGTKNGSYIYISTYNAIKGTEAQLISDVVVSPADKIAHCISFWYIVAGEKSTKLKVTSIPPGLNPAGYEIPPLWEVGESGYDTWKHGQVAVNGGMRVLITGVIGSPSTEGYIAVDDIVISANDSCETVPAATSDTTDVESLLSCSFTRYSHCKWSSTTTQSRRDWEFGSRMPPVLSTGPTRLPAEAKGDFIYCNALNLVPNLNTLRLTSVKLPRQDQPLCASFLYHMFAGREATLSLSLEQHSTVDGDHAPQILPVLQRSGRTTADRWYSVQRTIDVNADSSKFVFEVRNPKEVEVEVAIGPIQFTSGACDIVSESQGWCDFEYDTCNWNLDQAWVRKISEPLIENNFIRSGPEDSLYSVSLPATLAPKSYPLTSPLFDGKDEPQCLEFWYRRTNLKAGSLQVDILPEGGDQPQVLWKQPPYPNDDWMLSRVPIVQDKKFKVIFRGSVAQGSTSRSSLMLDNVAVHPQPCRPVVDCGFQDGLCGYVNGFTEDLRWLVGTGRVEWPVRVPRVPPRTLGETQTSFAYLDLSTRTEGQLNASLLSPVFQAGDQGDTLVLEYYRLGQDIIRMELSQTSYDDNTGDSKTLQTVPLNRDASWQTITMALKPAKHTQVRVSVTAVTRLGGIAAIGSIALKSKPTVALGCDFENNTFCGWKPDGGNIPWKLNDPVKKIPAFPRADHTLQSFKGHFIFAEQPSFGYTTAKLRSPVYPVEWKGLFCFSFWFLTLGNTKGTIEITAPRGSALRNADNSGAHHHWAHEQVQFSSLGKPFELNLTATMYKGLIALDDLKVRNGSCMAHEKCTFEPLSNCHLYAERGGVTPWRVEEASQFGTEDHTLQSKEGRVLYLNTTMLTGGAIHDASRVLLDSRPPTAASCLTFWWKGFGTPSDLNVYMYTKEAVLRDPVASVRTMTSSWWNVRSVTVSSKKDWMPLFEAISSPKVRQTSWIMVDDVEITDGECLPEKLCTFEEDVCKPWATAAVNASRLNEGLQLQRAELFQGLPKDHTLQSGEGYYLLFKSTGDPVDRASLMLRDERYQCASLWYFLSKSNDGCKIDVVTEQRSNATNRWTRVQFDLKSGLLPGAVHIRCGHDKDAYAAIDDVMVDERECSQIAQSTEVFDCGDKAKRSIPVDRVCNFVMDCPNGADEQNCGACDFARGTCGWNLQNDLNEGSVSWRRQRAGDIEDSPSIDWSASSKGYYLLMHATEKVKGYAGKAVAVAPTIRNTNYLCVLWFWYNYATANHTLGADLAMDVSGHRMTIWSLNAIVPKPAERTWTQAKIFIGRYNDSIQFYLSGYEYPMKMGYVAIDNIAYTQCTLPRGSTEKCLSPQFRCSNGVCIDKLEVCNYVDNCGDGSDEKNCGDHNLGCNFDTSFCDWESLSPTDEFTGLWKRTRPDRHMPRGPTRDHTTGHSEGGFLQLSASIKKKDALVAGPVIDPSSGCAITFFYIIYGKVPSSLTVNVRSTSNGTLKEVWRADKPTGFFHFVGGYTWLKEKEPFQVLFRGTIEAAGGASGYIAIDDVSFLKSCRFHTGSLPVAPPVPATTPSPLCPPGTFLCGSSRECIPQSQVCDFKQHCSDGSDEARCGACDFTQDMCGLTNRDPNGQYTWNRTFAQDSAKEPNGRLPKRDHGNNPQGFYAAYTNTNKEVPYRKNALLTPVLGRIAHSCIVSFYVFLTPNWLMTLESGVEKNETSGIPALRKTFAQIQGSGKWKLVGVKVGSWDPGYRFFYETNIPSACIDDIKYSNCHPDQRSSQAEAILSVSCDFKRDMKCAWFPENKEDDLDWILYDEDSSLQRWHPPQFGQGPGAYMAASSSITSGLKKAHLVSMHIPATESKFGDCFTFWYNMWHPNSGTLNLLLRADDNSTELIWTRSGPQGKAWQKGSVVLKSILSYQLVFEAILLGDNPAVVALNHFIFESCKPVTDPLRIDFESGMDKRWKISGWEVTNGKTATAPHKDHTTGAGAGSFALLRRSDGDLSTPPLKMKQPRCLKFWHFLSGTTSEQLEVRTTQSAEKPGSLWKIYASLVPQDRWLSGSVTLTESSTDVIATFAGSRSDDSSAIVAVDDIVIEDGACPPPGSCTFEDDFCNWRNADVNLDMMHWYQNSGRTMAWNSTVLRDHTTDSKEGKYLVLDAEDKSEKKGGVLESELLYYTSPLCLEFYYHMAVNGDNKLFVTFMDASKKLLARKSVPSLVAHNWTRFSYEVQNVQPPFTIRISGSPGKTARSDIAIDDISLKAGSCAGGTVQIVTSPAPGSTTRHVITTSPPKPLPEPTSTSTSESEGTTQESSPITDWTPWAPWTPQVLTCGPDQFSCRDNERCIPLALVCDGVQDCPNGVDEKCGDRNQCEADQVLCRTGSPQWCLPAAFLCDGHNDCSDGSDESLCGFCPSDYCKNGGSCSVASTPEKGFPKCTCPHDISGKRCTALQSASHQVEVARGGVNGWAVAVPVLLIIVAVASAIAFYVSRRRRKSEGESPLFLNNPTYDAQTGEAKIFQ